MISSSKFIPFKLIALSDILNLWRTLSLSSGSCKIVSSIMYSFSMTRGVIVQIGDYSTELVRFNRRVITNSVSIPVGTVTLLDQVKEKTMSDRMDRVVEIMTAEFKKYDWLYNLRTI